MKTIQECINWCNALLKWNPNVEDKNFFISIIKYLEKLKEEE